MQATKEEGRTHWGTLAESAACPASEPSHITQLGMASGNSTVVLRVCGAAPPRAELFAPIPGAGPTVLNYTHALPHQHERRHAGRKDRVWIDREQSSP